MATWCSPSVFEFAPVENRMVIASFDAGRITADASEHRAAIIVAFDTCSRISGAAAAP